MSALSITLAAGLTLHIGAHVALVVRLALRSSSDVGMGAGRDAGAGPPWSRVLRPLVALVIVPLAPLWAFRAGMRGGVLAWWAGLGVYALAVAVSAVAT